MLLASNFLDFSFPSHPAVSGSRPRRISTLAIEAYLTDDTILHYDDDA